MFIIICLPVLIDALKHFFSGRAQYKIATDLRPPGTYDMPINCPSMGLAYCMGLTFG